MSKEGAVFEEIPAASARIAEALDKVQPSYIFFACFNRNQFFLLVFSLVGNLENSAFVGNAGSSDRMLKQVRLCMWCVLVMVMTTLHFYFAPPSFA
jgi:hypothetical protein